MLMKISSYNLKKSNYYTAITFRKYETIFHNELLNHSPVKKIDKGHSSKIEPSSLISILNFKWTWQDQFFSHTL